MKTKRRLKPGMLGMCFRIVSILFVIGCCIFYGIRLIKYYKIYNPKVDSSTNSTVSGALLYNEIPRTNAMASSGSGLYRISGVYVYRGNVENNYIKFSNKLFRIVKINTDGTTEIVLNDNVDAMNYSDTFVNYNDSNINKYLNNEFLDGLNKDMLVKFGVCLDKINNIQQLSCKEIGDNYYVRNLDLSTYINSLINNQTYFTDGTKTVWLSNISDDANWFINGYNISTTLYNNTYEVKPIVTLKSTTQLLGGNGTMDNPYTIKES